MKHKHTLVHTLSTHTFRDARSPRCVITTLKYCVYFYFGNLCSDWYWLISFILKAFRKLVILGGINGLRYSGMDQVKFEEDSLSKIWSDIVCLGRQDHFKFFKDCLSQLLLGIFLNTLTQMNISNMDEKDPSVVAKNLNFDWIYWL